MASAKVKLLAKTARSAGAATLIAAAAWAADKAYARWLSFRCPPTESGLFEIYAVGDSTPAGVAYERELSFPSLVVKAFDGEINGRRIALTNLAQAGHTIYPQAHLLRHSLLCRNTANPGVVLIYSGHNDRMPGGPPPFFEMLKQRVLFYSTIFRDVHFFVKKTFILGQLHTRDAAAYHLRQTVELSLQSGLTPIIAAPAANVADMDPGLSDPRAEALLAPGQALEKSGRVADAVSYYRELGETTPALKAYANFRTGKCWQRLGKFLEAKRSFWAAIDENIPDNFGRASSQQLEYIRRLSRRYDIPLVDAVSLFARSSPDGLIGDALFLDGHHPNVEGTALLADAFAQAVSASAHEPVKRRFSGSTPLVLTPRQRAGGLLYGGRWLLGVSMRHAAPSHRLAMAEARLRAALALDPDNFSAWLALCLTRAARRGADVPALLGDIPYYQKTYSLSDKQFAPLLQKLKNSGVEEALLRQVVRSRALEKR